MCKNVTSPSSIRLGSISKSISGGTPSTNNPEFYNGEIPFISTPCLGPDFIDSSDTLTFITPLGIEKSATHLIPPYSLMVGIRIGVGKCSINTCSMCTNQDIISFYGFDSEKYEPLFLKKVVEMNSRKYISSQRGATIKGIKSEIIKNTIIPNVSLVHQQNYSMFINQIDKSKIMKEFSA